MEHDGKNQLNHQYRIRVDGSGRNTLRNYHFLRKCELKPAQTPISSATPGPITPSSNSPLLHPNPQTSSGNGTCTAIEPPKQTTYTSPCFQSVIIPWALSRLLPHNWLGLKEEYSPHTTRGVEMGDAEVTALTCRINSKNNNTYRFSGPS